MSSLTLPSNERCSITNFKKCRPTTAGNNVAIMKFQYDSNSSRAKDFPKIAVSTGRCFRCLTFRGEFSLSRETLPGQLPASLSVGLAVQVSM